MDLRKITKNKVKEALAASNEEVVKIMREFKYKAIQQGHWEEIKSILLTLPEFEQLAERLWSLLT